MPSIYRILLASSRDTPIVRSNPRIEDSVKVACSSILSVDSLYIRHKTDVSFRVKGLITVPCLQLRFNDLLATEALSFLNYHRNTLVSPLPFSRLISILGLFSRQAPEVKSGILMEFELLRTDHSDNSTTELNAAAS